MGRNVEVKLSPAETLVHDRATRSEKLVQTDGLQKLVERGIVDLLDGPEFDRTRPVGAPSAGLGDGTALVAWSFAPKRVERVPLTVAARNVRTGMARWVSDQEVEEIQVTRNGNTETRLAMRTATTPNPAPAPESRLRKLGRLAGVVMF